MKLKYYLRGVGAGILFATVILSVSYRVSSKTQLSDAEIIKRAEELGMVKQSDINLDDLIEPTVTPAADPTASPAVTPSASPTPEPAQKPSDAPTKEPAGESTLAPTKEPVDSGEETGSTPETTPETDAAANNVPFKIVKGMTSEDVSNLLKGEGIIEDARAFNQYLKQNNYTTRINIGEYQIEKFASYQDIADAIISK